MSPGARSTRARLAEATRAAHEALHVHPLVARLLAPDLTRAEYRACLAANLGFSCAIERARETLTIWPDLSLAEDIAALDADLGAGVAHLRSVRLASPGHLLGALYVAHGAQFGGQVIARNLRTALPAAPRRFFGRAPRPDRWRDLLQRLGSFDETELEAGAGTAFALFHDLADAALRRLPACEGAGTAA